MNWLASLFWNPAERRVRVAWRFAVQGLIWFMILLVGQAAVFVAIVRSANARGEVPPDLFGDLSVLSGFVAGTPARLFALQAVSFVAVLVSVWLAGRFLDRRPFADFGLRLSRAWWLDFAFGLVLGAVLMTLVFGAELALGWVRVTGTFATAEGVRMGALAGVFTLLLTYLMVGFSEELMNRGYLLLNTAEWLNGGLGPRAAIWISLALSSVFFGLLHATNPGATLVSTVSIMLAGVLLLGLGMALTGEIAIPIGVHITWNFFQGVVFGFPVSGNPPAASVIALAQVGPPSWTGGAFGPEAGLTGLLAMLLGAGLTVLWLRARYGEARVHLPLAFYEPAGDPSPPVATVEDTHHEPAED